MIQKENKKTIAGFLLVILFLFIVIIIIYTYSKGNTLTPEEREKYQLLKDVWEEPEPWDLSSPDNAVWSYLLWRSHSYRTVNSDVSTPTMNAREQIRVDSYIEFNRQQGKYLNAIPLSVDFLQIRTTEATSVVTTYEKWHYSYYDINDKTLLEGPIFASYDATYTLTLDGKEWKVESVETREVLSE